MPGSHGLHLSTDDLGHLLDQDRVPGGSESKALGENGRIPMAKPTRGFLVDDDRNAQPGPFDSHLLDSIHERCTLLWMQTSRGANARYLPNAVRHLLGNGIRVEGTRTHKSGAPQAAELGQLLIERHESEQVLDSLLNGGVRVAIERCGQMCTPFPLFKYWLLLHRPGGGGESETLG